MEDMRIKVKTEALVSASENLTAKVQKAKNTFQQIENIISKTNTYWEGFGQEAMYNAYSSRSDDFNRIFDEIGNHVTNLNTIAGVYSVIEKGAVDVISDLPGDVIL